MLKEVGGEALLSTTSPTVHPEFNHVYCTDPFSYWLSSMFIIVDIYLR